MTYIVCLLFFSKAYLWNWYVIYYFNENYCFVLSTGIDENSSHSRLNNMPSFFCNFDLSFDIFDRFLMNQSLSTLTWEMIFFLMLVSTVSGSCWLLFHLYARWTTDILLLRHYNIDDLYCKCNTYQISNLRYLKILQYYALVVMVAKLGHSSVIILTTCNLFIQLRQMQFWGYTVSIWRVYSWSHCTYWAFILKMSMNR